MLLASYYLKDNLNRIEFIQKSLQKQVENGITSISPNEEKQFVNLKNAFKDMQNAMHELMLLNSSYSDVQDIQYAAEKSMITCLEIEHNLNTAKTKKEYLNAITPIMEIDERFRLTLFEETSKYKFSYSFFHYDETNYFSTTEIAWLRDSLINSQNRNIKLLSVPVKSVNSMKALNKDIDNIDIYGIDIDDNLDKKNDEVKNTFKRLISGPLKGSTISNDVFDVLLTSPDISLEASYLSSNSNIIAKEEKKHLIKVISYLRVGGTMVLRLPKFRFYKDICMFLALNFADAEIYCSSPYESIDWIYFIAKKVRKRNVVDKDIYNTLRNLYDSNTHLQRVTTSKLKPIAFSKGEIELKQFRGSKIDDDELEMLFTQSNATVQFWKEQTPNNLTDTSMRPLLPFNVGQIGLVLTSGCLDGVIDEGNGFYHAVKGRVINKVEDDRSINTAKDVVEVNQTTANRVEISSFLPDGTYKVLA